MTVTLGVWFAVLLALAPAAAADNRGAVPYLGGPVMPSERTYAILWDPGGQIAQRAEGLLARYLQDLAHDSGQSTNVFSVLEQYTDSSGAHAAYAQSFGGAFTDKDPYPASAAGCLAYADVYAQWPPGTHCLVDSQIQAELSSFIAVHALPTGLTTLYVLFTPKSVPVCQDDFPGDMGICSTRICGYHFHIGANVIYAEIPMTDSPNDQQRAYLTRCGGHPTQAPNGEPVADTAIDVVSHEMSEAITDPLDGYPFTAGNDPAWAGSSQGEVADRCEKTGNSNLVGNDPRAFRPTLGGSNGTLYTELINGHPYYTQSDWSNAANRCLMRTGPPANPPPSSAPRSPSTSARRHPLPNTRIVNTIVHRKKHTASFSFKASNRGSGFRCALTRNHHRASFAVCRSPKRYAHLHRGAYVFEVVARGPAGADRTPAARRFTIR